MPKSTVKLSHGINVHNLIQKIENHPQRHAIQDNNMDHPIFAVKKTQDVIKAVGNIELFEKFVVGLETHVCRIGTLTSSSARVGNFDEMIQPRSTLSPFLISSLSRFLHQNRPTTRSQVRDTANQFQKKYRKKQFWNIHDRFIYDTWFRKTMLELGRTEEVIREMDRLANEDHTHIATDKKKLDVYRDNTMPMGHRPDLKKALSTLHRFKKAEDKAYYQNWSQSSSSSWW